MSGKELQPYEKTVDMSRANIALGLEFWTVGEEYVCNYAGIYGRGDTMQEAFNEAFKEHQRLCEEENDYREMSN